MTRSNMLSLFEGNNPFVSMINQMHQMENLFSDVFNLDDIRIFRDIQPKGSFPKVNVREKEKEYSVSIAAAGYEKEQIDLEVKNNSLIINLEKKVEKEDKDSKWLAREITSSKFHRIVAFNKKIDSDNLEATYKNGIVTVTIPKVAPKEKKTVKVDIK